MSGGHRVQSTIRMYLFFNNGEDGLVDDWLHSWPIKLGSALPIVTWGPMGSAARAGLDLLLLKCLADAL